MDTPGSPPESGRRRSDVLDAIFEAVEEKPTDASTPSSHLFRAKALAQIDIPKQIDNLLPITSPKIWIAIAGVAGVLIAAIIYAAGTPQVTSVTTTGRAVAESGVVTVGTIDEFVLNRMEVTEGIEVRQGALLAEGTGADGAAVLTILPAGSDTHVFVPMPQDVSSGVQVGQSAQVLGADFAVSGTVSAISETPLPSDRAAALTSLTLNPADTYISVSVSIDDAITPGEQVTVEIIESESTLLNELIDIG